MQNQSIKKVVAIGIGAALFVIIGMLINIPTPIPNTSIQLQYAVLALFAIIYGPSVGFFTGLIGHALKDAFQSGNPWWTWILVSALIGFVIGLRIIFGSISSKWLPMSLVGAFWRHWEILLSTTKQATKFMLKDFYPLGSTA